MSYSPASVMVWPYCSAHTRFSFQASSSTLSGRCTDKPHTSDCNSEEIQFSKAFESGEIKAFGRDAIV